MLGGFPRWGWTTKYTRSLETEVARLRAENLALMNSILGVAGVPPLRFDHPRIDSAAREQSYGDMRGGAAIVSEPQSIPLGKSAVAPVRRRSWRQIGRELEAEDASRQQG
jgi:hypothetical protein